jgi:hypothetical protein
LTKGRASYCQFVSQRTIGVTGKAQVDLTGLL